MTEETNIITNEIIETESTIYEVAKDINLMVSVLTFTIIVIFLYKYLKDSFKRN